MEINKISAPKHHQVAQTDHTLHIHYAGLSIAAHLSAVHDYEIWQTENVKPTFYEC